MSFFKRARQEALDRRIGVADALEKSFEGDQRLIDWNREKVREAEAAGDAAGAEHHRAIADSAEATLNAMRKQMKL